MMHDDNFRSRSQLVRQSARAHLLDIRRARLANSARLAESSRLANNLRLADRIGLEPTAPIVADLSADEPQAAEPVIEAVPQAADLPPEAPVATIAPPDAPTILPDPLPLTLMDALEEAALHSVGLPDPPTTAFADETPLPAPTTPPRKPAVTPPTAILPATAPPIAAEIPFDADIYRDTPVEHTILAEPSGAASQPTSPPMVAMAEPPAMTMAEAEVTDIPTDADLPAPALDLPKDDAGDLIALPGAGPGLIWMLQQCGITTMRDLAQADAADLTLKLGLVGQILNIQTWLDHARSHMRSA